MDVEKGLQYLTTSSEANHADAQCKLGYIDQNGKPFGRDGTLALALYTKAAEQGHIGAIFNLACMYRDGDCEVERDYVRARLLFERAAEEEHAGAICGLGGLYDAGQGGCDQDHHKSFELYRQAAVSGYPPALYNAGCALRNGEGVEQNAVLALDAFEAAAARGHSKAQFNVGCMHAVGQGTRVNLVRARASFERAAKLGYAGAEVATKKADNKLKSRSPKGAPGRLYGKRVLVVGCEEWGVPQGTAGLCVDWSSSSQRFTVDLDGPKGSIKAAPSKLRLEAVGLGGGGGGEGRGDYRAPGRSPKGGALRTNFDELG